MRVHPIITSFDMGEGMWRKEYQSGLGEGGVYQLVYVTFHFLKNKISSRKVDSFKSIKISQ